MNRILVSGANGQLGQSIKTISYLFPNFEFHFKDRKEMDFADDNSITKAVMDCNPKYIINCAAYTAVDRAETDSELCFKINTYALKSLCEAAKSCNSTLIHLSSDYVYHIKKEGPLKEVDATNPIGIYAKSKLDGEHIVLSAMKRAIVLRTSWVYSEFGNNFVKTLIKLTQSKTELNIVNDQIGAPCYAIDLAHVILKIIQHIESNDVFDDWGIYNFSNEGIASWYDFAQEIYRLSNSNMKLNAISTEDYNAIAVRPLWSVLSQGKIKKTFDLEIRHWRLALKECMHRLKEN
jgi:dTDP-4-dehydrorhamnose reductase